MQAEVCGGQGRGQVDADAGGLVLVADDLRRGAIDVEDETVLQVDGRRC